MAFEHPAAVIGWARLRPNFWDLVAFALVFSVLILLGQAGRETLAPLASVQQTPISLDPTMLPEYGLRTTLRMLAAILASLLFTLSYAALAAKSRRAEIVLIPLLDILQSVPVLGFLSFTVAGFMALVPGRVLGVELAAVFAIFTSQAWNMAFSFYQSLKTVPRDLEEASRSFRLSALQRFWQLEVPFAMPGLVWNTMMSMSGGWFFVVASEAITVGDTTVSLPGIGSYLARAIEDENLAAICWAVLAMFVIILVYDQLLFRPLVAWAEKFRFEQSASATQPSSWMLTLLKRTHLARTLMRPIGHGLQGLFKVPTSVRVPLPGAAVKVWSSRWVDGAWMVAIVIATLYALWRIEQFVTTEVSLQELGHAMLLATFTMIRVIVLIALATVIWVPIGVWVGLRPRLAEAVQPIAQFLAAFPANIIFPFVVVAIVYFRVSPDIWLSPLMILGTQWYILFNVIAGASAFPTDLKEAAASLRIQGWQWWRQAILPGIFPYYVTGAITASGGSWNASIVAEVASWGSTKLKAQGIGAYIADATAAGDYPRIVLGVAVMSVFVLLFNRLLWRPMYAFAARRLRLD